MKKSIKITTIRTKLKGEIQKKNDPMKNSHIKLNSFDRIKALEKVSLSHL